MMNKAEYREKILERDLQLDQLGMLIIELTECAENLANIIEAEVLIDEEDPRKMKAIEDTNDAAVLLAETTANLNEWVDALTDPWEGEL